MQMQSNHDSRKHTHKLGLNNPGDRNNSQALTKPDISFIATTYGKGKSQKNGTGYLTLCPLHHDTRPSLSLKLDANGQLNCYCHAGCDSKRVRKRIKTDFPHFFKGKRKYTGRKKPLAQYIYEKAGPLDEKVLSYFSITRGINLSGDTLAKTIRNLIALGEITMETRKTRGRPVTIYKKVNTAELSPRSHNISDTCNLDTPGGVMEL